MTDNTPLDDRIAQFFYDVPDFPPEDLLGGNSATQRPPSQIEGFWKQVRDSINSATNVVPCPDHLPPILAAIIRSWADGAVALRLIDTKARSTRHNLQLLRQRLLQISPDDERSATDIESVEQELIATLRPHVISSAAAQTTSVESGVAYIPREKRSCALLALITWLECSASNESGDLLIDPPPRPTQHVSTSRDVVQLMKSGEIKAALFDGYGTLVDWVPTIRRCLVEYAERYFPEASQQRVRTNPSDPHSTIDGNVLLLTYDYIRRQVQIDHPRELYPDVLRRSLDEFATCYGVAPIAAESERFSKGPRTWPAFTDSGLMLAHLRENGFFVCAISNIDNASFDYTCERVLRFRFDEAVTAENMKQYKPNPRLLDEMVARLRRRNIEPHQVVLVSQSLYADHTPAEKYYPDILRVHIDRPESILGLQLKHIPAVDMKISSLADLDAVVFGMRPVMGTK